MKFYLTFSLLFLSLSCGTSALFAQEHVKNGTGSPSPKQSDHQTQTIEHPGPVKNSHADLFDLPEEIIYGVEHETDTFQAKFLNMLVILGLLIGFMILASWSLKRLMKAKLNQHATGSAIKVLETRYLSPRATLYLVEIQNRTILIAESPTAVTYLTLIPQEAEGNINESG